MEEWERGTAPDQAQPSRDFEWEDRQSESAPWSDPEGDAAWSEAEGDAARGPQGDAGEHTRAEPARPDAEPLRVKESPARAVTQGVLAVIGIAFFAALVLVWRQQRDDVTMLVALIGVLLMILLVEVLLLRPIFDRLFRHVPSSLPLTPDEDNFIVGCPGCGTVFTVTEEDLQGGFSCHNCNRPGYIKDYQLNRGAIKQETCRTCGNTYLEYLEHSECPVCHTYNAY